MRRVGWIAIGLLFAAIVPFRTAHAHPLAPSLLELRELDDGRIDVVWKTPRVRVTGADLRPQLTGSSGRCRTVGEPVASVDAESAVARWIVDCGPRGAIGVRVGVEGLARSRTDAIVRVEFAQGHRFDAVLTASNSERVIPPRSSRGEVAGDYMNLGLQHILTGPDHLLFVLGLL